MTRFHFLFSHINLKRLIRQKGSTIMNTLKFLGAAALVSFLVACGGGGGDTTPPVAISTGTITSVAKNVTIQQDLSTGTTTINWSTKDATNVFVKDASGATVGSGVSGSAAVNVRVGTNIVSLYSGTTVLGTVTITGACVGGTTPDATGNCKAPVVAGWWPPKNVTPIGTKVFNANQLPQGCNAWAQQCWKDSVANGTVKFITTSATGANPRPIVFAYFRNTSTAFGVTGLWNVLPIYADDGSLAANDIFGGIASEIDQVLGNSSGVILHDKPTGICVELYYFAQGFTWSSREVICPQ